MFKWRFIGFLYRVSWRVFRLDHFILMIAIFIFTYCRNTGCGDLVTRYHISCVILCNIYRPYKNPVCNMVSIFICLRLQYICHSCIGIHHSIAVSFPIQMVYNGSFWHFPVTDPAYPLQLCEIPFKHFVHWVIWKLCEISPCKFKYGLTSWKSVNRWFTVRLILVLFITFQLLYGYFFVFFIPAIKQIPSIDLLCPCKRKGIQVII